MDPASPELPSGEHRTAPALGVEPDHRAALRHAIITNSPAIAAELSPLIVDPTSRSDALRIQEQLRREFMGAAIEKARLDPAPRLAVYETLADGLNVMIDGVVATSVTNPDFKAGSDNPSTPLPSDLPDLSAIRQSFQASRRNLVLTEGAEIFPVFYCYEWEKVAEKLTDAEHELLAKWYIPDHNFPFTFRIVDDRSLAAARGEVDEVAEILAFLSGKDADRFDQLLSRFGEVPTVLGPERWTVKDGGFEVYGSVFGLRVPYGSYDLHQKFLESRQQMLEKGEVAQLSVEISGRIDPAFLAWARGSGSQDLGPIPDVELIYSLELPSGANYRFILKEARGYTQKPENDRSSYTAQDHEVLAGLGSYLSSPEARTASGLFTTFRDEDFEADLLPLLEHPWDINSLRNFMDVERGWVKSLHEQLREYAIDGRDNLDSTGWMGVWNGDVTELKSTIWDRLNSIPDQHPEFAPDYLRLTSNERERFLTEYVPILVEIFTAESARLEKELADSDIHAERLALEYDGPVAGFALSLDEMLIDMIVDMKEGGGDPYPTAGAGFEAAEIYDHLDRASSERSVVAIVHDPLSSDPLTYHPQNSLAGLSERMLDTNLARMLPKVEAYIRESGVSDEGGKSNSPVELFARVVRSSQSSIAAFEKSIEEQQGNQDEVAKLTHALREEKVLLLEIIREALPVVAEKSCIRLDRITDQHLTRFVFVVDPDGTPRFAEDRTTPTGRPETTQSKLAGGKNLYAGGELIFARHQEVFHDVAAWAAFDRSLSEQGAPTPWSLSELNNRSVGYHISGSSLPYAESILIPLLQDQGILMTGVRVTDRLVPGAYL